MSSVEKPKDESLYVEYTATNDAYMHYDNFSWQVGAILIAGTFVFWGFLIDKDIDPTLFTVCSILIAILMSIWMIYSNNNRQIYLYKLHRLREIEDILRLEQHRRWVSAGDDKQPMYRTFGLHGHILDIVIYAVLSLGAPIIDIFKNTGFCHCLAPTILLMVMLVIFLTCYNEHKLKDHLKNLSKKNITKS